MRKIVLLLVLFVPGTITIAQNLTGFYEAEGYFFHPSLPRAYSYTKSVIWVEANRYQLNLGDLGASGYRFLFEVDAENNLINWEAVDVTPAAPSSGFMTMDNPGGISFTAPIPPGTSPYLHSIYNNRYDPVTKTFYLHYGYAIGSTGETGFTRQVYEKLTLIPEPNITSVTPLSGTAGTEVTIRGTNFTKVDPAFKVEFGWAASISDSAVVVSDSVIKAWVGISGSGYVIVGNIAYHDSFPGFIYNAVPTPSVAPWQYLGNPGFSANQAYLVNAAIGKNNTPYTAFIDAVDRRVRVMKYNGNNWIGVGNIASDGASPFLKMAMDTAGNPVLAFADSTNNGYLTVKKFDGNNWVDLQLASQFLVSSRLHSIAVDRQNSIYVAWHNGDTTVTILKYTGSGWIHTGYVTAGPGSLAIAIGKDDIPYVIYPATLTGLSYRNQACVMKLSANNWVPVGEMGFTSAPFGIDYLTLSFDTSGAPVAIMKENDGFERLSAFRFDSSSWNCYSCKFNKSRASMVTQAIGTDNSITVAYMDNSYNNRGTVLTYRASQAKWDTVGLRGFIPCQRLEQNALQRDRDNNLMITFSDISQGGRVSVMKLVTEFVWTGMVDNHWENPLNWNVGMVPSGTSNVFINAGATVQLNSNAKVNSIHINPGAILSIANGYTLTVLGP